MPWVCLQFVMVFSDHLFLFLNAVADIQTNNFERVVYHLLINRSVIVEFGKLILRLILTIS